MSESRPPDQQAKQDPLKWKTIWQEGQHEGYYAGITLAVADTGDAYVLRMQVGGVVVTRAIREWHKLGSSVNQLRPESRPALKPEVLADALQDRLGPTSGRLITSRPVAAASRPPDDTPHENRPVEGPQVSAVSRPAEVRSAPLRAAGSTPADSHSTVAPDDTPPRVVLSQCCHSYMAGDERYCPKCGQECRIMDVPPVAPSLCHSSHEWSNQFGDDWTPEVGTPCDCGQRKWGIPAPVAPDDTPTRLQHVQDELWQRWLDGDKPAAMTYEKFLVAEVSRLQQENALLRRSLEMLTKQLDEKDAEITDLRFTIIRHNSPA